MKELVPLIWELNDKFEFSRQKKMNRRRNGGIRVSVSVEEGYVQEPSDKETGPDAGGNYSRVEL